MSRPCLDDTLNWVLIAVTAASVIGLATSVSMGYVLDRGSAQARADGLERWARAVAAGEAETANREAARLDPAPESFSFDAKDFVLA